MTKTVPASPFRARDIDFLAGRLFSYFKFIRDHGDGLSVLDHVGEKGPCPSQSRFKVGLTPQVPPSFCQHPDEIICFEVTIFTKYFVDNHLITSVRNGIPAPSANPDDSPLLPCGPVSSFPSFLRSFSSRASRFFSFALHYPDHPKPITQMVQEFHDRINSWIGSPFQRTVKAGTIHPQLDRYPPDRGLFFD